MVLPVGFCIETELALGELVGSAAGGVKFPEKDATCADKLESTDTEGEGRGSETLCDCPDNVNTDVATRPWLLPPSTESMTLLLICSVWLAVGANGTTDDTALMS